MTHRRLTGLLVLALTIPSLANAASTTLVTTLGHLLLNKGLSPTQARATAHSAAYHYHGAPCSPYWRASRTSRVCRPGIMPTAPLRSRWQGALARC